MQVEDHPPGLRRLRGAIEESSYGAGQAIVWDEGTYRNLDKDHSMVEALDAGHATFWSDGHKADRRLDAPAHARRYKAPVAADQTT